jgi:hypothetical protein
LYKRPQDYIFFPLILFVMNKLFYSLSIWTLALPGHAQYATTPPVQDGVPNASEYNNNSFKTSDGGTWYMTWDATNLYIGKTGGTMYEPAIVYLDLNPILPVNGGADQQGNLKGVNEVLKRRSLPGVQSGVVPLLPFRADVRVYCTTDGEISISRATGTGSWGPESQSDIFLSNSGSSREMVLKWSALTGGGTIPAAFNWLGYASNDQNNGANYRYDLAPYNSGAASYNNGIAPELPYYYTVLSTANGSATLPFNLMSYTYVTPSSNYQIGEIAVWDFTMNSPGLQIGRGTTGRDWSVSGSLIVGGGTLYFGSPAGTIFGNTNVGNIRMLGNGILDMDQTNKPLTVRETVYLTGGSQLVLSGQAGGDLNVGRDFIVNNGSSSPATFQPNKRTVTFTGSGVTHTISTNNGYEIPFNFLTLTTPSSSLTINSNIFILNKLSFQQGNLYTGANYVKLDGAAILENETATSHLIGNVTIDNQSLNGGGAGAQTFGNLGLVLNPQGSSPYYGTITLTRVTGTTIPGVGKGSNGSSIQRYFVVNSTNASTSNLDLALQFFYRTDELNNIQEANLALYKSIGGAPGTYSKLTSPPSANTTNHSISFDYKMQLENNTYITASDAVTPLPVTLVAFTAKATAKGTALLNWNTASEKNSKGFGIERQLGLNEPWQSVGYVAAANLLTGSTYQFEDKALATAAASPRAYYRLRQEDLDGTTAYSPVAVIARPDVIGSTELVLSPVPATEANLSVTFAEVGQAGLEIAVLNTQGQRMLNFTTAASTDAALSLPVQTLAPGIYIVRVQAPGQPMRYARFVKP